MNELNPVPRSASARLSQITLGATYQDVLAAPANRVAELINGALHTHPRPAPRHVFAGSALNAALGAPFGFGVGGPGGWRILVEPEIHFGANVLVPDLAGWRRERMPRLPETAYFPVTPDWVCEILSPATRTYDLTEKRDIYAASGVKYLWFIDPEARTLEAFALLEGGWMLIDALHDSAGVAVAPFDAAPFSLSLLWDDA